MSNIFEDLFEGKKFETEKKETTSEGSYERSISIMPSSILKDKQEHRKATDKIFQAESKEREAQTKQHHKVVRETISFLGKPTKSLKFHKTKGGVF